MASIGLNYLVYKGATSGVMAKVMQADMEIDLNDTKLYADDSISESDKSFKSGKLKLGVTKLSNTIHAELLGHDVDVDGQITSSATDISPYVGVGFYVTDRENAVDKYRAIWIPKVQFGEPNISGKTREESISFATPTIEGTIFADASHNWKQERTFDNEADAVAYLQAKAGMPVTASGGLTGLSMTGTGGTLSPAFGAAVRYFTFGGVTGASVTITATAANHTIKLYIDGAYSQELTSGAASAAIPMSVGTKKLTIVAQETGKQSQETEVIVVKTA